MADTAQGGVRILVIGRNNTGKTTIAHIIKAALEEHQFTNVFIHDSEDDSPGKQPIHLRIQRTRVRPVHIEVQVETVAANAEATFSEEGPQTGRISSKK